MGINGALKFVVKSFIIGFTAGVWDFCHVGHINFFKKCRKDCDYLIVSVASDYITRVQKGHDRPIHSCEKRIIDVMNTGLVDKTISTDGLDMGMYLQIADIWFKGEEGQLNLLPEKFANIKYIPRTPGISTTLLIEDM